MVLQWGLQTQARRSPRCRDCSQEQASVYASDEVGSLLQAQVQGHWLSVCAVVPVPQRAIFVVPTAEVRSHPLLRCRIPLARRVSSAVSSSVHLASSLHGVSVQRRQQQATMIVNS